MLCLTFMGNSPDSVWIIISYMEYIVLTELRRSHCHQYPKQAKCSLKSFVEHDVDDARC